MKRLSQAHRFATLVRSLIHRTHGQDLIEYAILAAVAMEAVALAVATPAAALAVAGPAVAALAAEATPAAVAAAVAEENSR